MINIAFKKFMLQLSTIFPLLLIGWQFTPYKDHIIGFGIGLIVSMYCMWMLGRRVDKVGEAIVGKRKAPRLGTVYRFSAAILGAILLYELELEMTIGAFIGGIMFGYALMLITLAYYTHLNGKKENTKKIVQ
jgi:ATP synthase protein I